MEDLRVTHVRGPVTQQIRDTVLKAKGRAAWEALLAQVSGLCREVFSKPIGVYEWVDADLAAEMSVTFLAQEGVEWARIRGQDAAREQILTVHRWLLKLASPAFLLNNTPRILSLYYRGCAGQVDRAGPGEADLSLWAHGYYPEWYSHGLVGWLQGALELTGARNPRITYQPPFGEGLEAVRHRYRVTWEA